MFLDSPAAIWQSAPKHQNGWCMAGCSSPEMLEIHRVWHIPKCSERTHVNMNVCPKMGYRVLLKRSFWGVVLYPVLRHTHMKTQRTNSTVIINFSQTGHQAAMFYNTIMEYEDPVKSKVWFGVLFLIIWNQWLTLHFLQVNNRYVFP